MIYPGWQSGQDRGPVSPCNEYGKVKRLDTIEAIGEKIFRHGLISRVRKRSVQELQIIF